MFRVLQICPGVRLPMYQRLTAALGPVDFGSPDTSMRYYVSSSLALGSLGGLPMSLCPSRVTLSKLSLLSSALIFSRASNLVIILYISTVIVRSSPYIPCGLEW